MTIHAMWVVPAKSFFSLLAPQIMKGLTLASILKQWRVSGHYYYYYFFNLQRGGTPEASYLSHVCELKKTKDKTLPAAVVVTAAATSLSCSQCYGYSVQLVLLSELVASEKWPL